VSAVTSRSPKDIVAFDGRTNFDAALSEAVGDLRSITLDNECSDYGDDADPGRLPVTAERLKALISAAVRVWELKRGASHSRHASDTKK